MRYPAASRRVIIGEYVYLLPNVINNIPARIPKRKIPFCFRFCSLKINAPGVKVIITLPLRRAEIRWEKRFHLFKKVESFFQL
jgi:hypothetical protein